MNASAAHRHDPADAWFVAVVASAGGLKAITRTVAIVLTGTGSDGSEGVRKVKKRSGTVIVQGDAEYPGMPSAAIATGAVDYVLPLAAIAPSVLAIVNRSGVERV